LKDSKKQIRRRRLRCWLWLFFLGLALQITVGLAKPALGHYPEGVAYRAFQFPDHLVPAIDGDLTDWEVVGDSYAILTGQFHDLISPEVEASDSDDFAARLMVGWNKAENRLYIAAQVRDDIHQIDRPAGSAEVIFRDDAMELFIDADHSGGQFANFTELSDEEYRRRNGTEANHFVLAGPPPDEDFFVNYSAAAWYALPDGPYTRAAVEFAGVLGGEGVTNYEVMLVPFDRVDINAVFQSEEHLLRAGEILGFNVEFNDLDVHSELFDAKWSLSGQHNSYRFSDRFTDLIMMPLEGTLQGTAVEPRSWGRLKASLYTELYHGGVSE
jgi:hypothetical protein